MHSRQAFSAAVAILVALVFPNLTTAYYSPRQGRFIGRDPIGEEGGETVRLLTGAAAGLSPEPISRTDQTTRVGRINDGPLPTTMLITEQRHFH